VSALEISVRKLIEASGAGFAGVATLSVDGSPWLLADAHRPVHAASTMKIPVLLELYLRGFGGDLSLDDTLVVRNAFRSIADESPYALDPSDDSETDLYRREGETVTLRELARLMIVVSSNLATNLLVDRLGAKSVSATMRSLGAPGLVVLRGVEDGPAHRAGLDNTVTAGDLAHILARVARGEAGSTGAAAGVEAVLAGQRFNEGIPAGLPPGSYVAHKTGSIDRLYHDAGIVRPTVGPPYVLAVLTTGLPEAEAGPALVAAIARVVDAHVRTLR
jgi:beta-lactamase class A